MPTKKPTTKVFFKTSNKKAFPLVVRNMEELDFHSLVILYWKLSLMWLEGRGGAAGGRKRAAEEPRTLPVLLPQARPASSPRLGSQPAAGTCDRSAPHHGREKEERKAEASGLGPEILLRWQPRRRGSQANATAAPRPVPSRG